MMKTAMALAAMTLATGVRAAEPIMVPAPPSSYAEGPQRDAFEAGRAYERYERDRRRTLRDARRPTSDAVEPQAPREVPYGEGFGPETGGITYAPSPTPDSRWIATGPGYGQGYWMVPAGAGLRP